MRNWINASFVIWIGVIILYVSFITGVWMGVNILYVLVLL